MARPHPHGSHQPRRDTLLGAGWGVVVSVLALSVQAQFDSDAASYWRAALTAVCVVGSAVIARTRSGRDV